MKELLDNVERMLKNSNEIAKGVETRVKLGGTFPMPPQACLEIIQAATVSSIVDMFKDYIETNTPSAIEVVGGK